MESPRHSCLKLELPNPTELDEIELIFIKATWYDTHFDLSITNGLDSWVCKVSEEDVRERAAQWDQPVAEYIELAERYLGFQQPGSVYKFTDAGNGQRRLSWTFEKEGTKLEWRWKCQPSPNPKQTNSGILNFLMDANIRLSEEVVRKTKSFERLKVETEKCLAQSESFSNEKTEFESAIYAKFLSVLNSKKGKLRELREQLVKAGGNGGKSLEEDEESTEKTDPFDEGSDSEVETVKSGIGTSEDVQKGKSRGRKGIALK
ncbi:DNA repair protein XRCC4-like [Punica granatum]|uniref:Uncharacterized protein n=2 Tax=Punica granatum TaxID=22663 RepID=A0A2I0KH52_PUNGR|nr:DNA repair protein XRCC4-like [Punica granatum]PKI67828.1 hypothetical protein CRG98_011801 [Punica granatum]